MKQELLNTIVDNLTMEECLTRIKELIESNSYHYVVTPNVDHIVKLQSDYEFRKVYKNASLVLVDGMPLVWYSKIKGMPIKEKLSGSDLFPRVCDLANKNNYKIFLLGGLDGVAEEAKNNLMQKYSNLQIVGTYSPPFGFEKDPDEVNKIIKMINEKRPHILAVGLGAPKQEKFISKYLNELKVPISLAIGASIDFEANKIKRAPRWMQRCGLEWFYRFIKEPRRMFKRYFIDDFKIIYIVYKDLLKHKSEGSR